MVWSTRTGQDWAEYSLVGSRSLHASNTKESTHTHMVSHVLLPQVNMTETRDRGFSFVP